MRQGGKLLRLGCSLLGLSLLVCYPLRWWVGDRWFPVRLFNYFAPWLLVSAVPVLVIAWLDRRYRKEWLIIATLMILMDLPSFLLFLPQPRAEPAASLTFKMMSYSVCSNNHNIEGIIHVIRQVQPDLLLLQEVRPDVAGILRRELVDLYLTSAGDFHFLYAPEVGQAVISRYSLTSLGVAPEQGRVQKVRMDTPGGSITVWNVHIVQPEIWIEHYQEFLALVEAFQTVDGPFIVAGDFNTTEQTEAYRLVARHLYNAHRQTGWGFGFTFPASSPDPDCWVDEPVAPPILWPLVRIDHIFFSDHFFARQAGTLAESGGSEHLPVVAELSLKN